MGSWDSWDDVATNVNEDRSRSAIEAQTGYRPETLDELWNGKAERYFILIPGKRRRGSRTRSFETRKREMWRSQHYFYIFLMYIHLYPPEDNMIDTLVTSRCKVTRKGFYKDIMPLARKWSLYLNHIRWEDRLKYDNHHPMFPFQHTCIWDSTCMRVQRSPDWGLARNVVNGHYDFPCFLVLIAITFTGELVFGSELFRVNSYDAHTFMDTRHLHPQLPFERNLGDGHFRTVPRFDTPFQKDGGRMLLPHELIWNKWVQLPRSRVEHLNCEEPSHVWWRAIPWVGRAIGLVYKGHASRHSRRAAKKEGTRWPPLCRLWLVGSSLN